MSLTCYNIIKKGLSVVCALITVFVLLSGALCSGAAFSGDDRIIVVIDPGHGGNDGTGTAIGDYEEKDATLELAGYLKEYLEENGSFEVYMTRTSDTALNRAKRAYYADSVNADLLFSIHFNGSPSPSANGVSAWTSVLPEYAVDSLGYMVLSNLSALGFSSEGVMHRKAEKGYYWNTERQWDIKDPSLGLYSDYYGIPTYSCKFGIQSVIVEHGYFTNSHDANLILSAGMIRKMAEADAEAIIDYYTGHMHTYGERQTDFPSNCLMAGKTSIHCTVCRHRKSVTELPASPENHYYYVSSYTEKATCTTDRQVTYVCRIAEDMNENGIVSTEHIVNDVTEKATGHKYFVKYHTDVGHITNGVTVTVCANCGDSYTKTEYAPGHTWERTDHLDPGCTSDGGDSYRCSVCGEERYDVIPAPGHLFIRNALLEEPTCTEPGSEDVTCSVCGYNCVRPVDSLGHDFYRTALLNEPDCTLAGKEAVVCNRCGLETERDIPALGHLKNFLEHMDSTCSVQGYDKYYCDRCGSDYYVYIDKPPHDMVAVAEAEATCGEDGYIEYECSVCGEGEREITQAASHKYEKKESIPAGCETDGKIVSVCSVCQNEDVYVIPAVGHNWDEGKITRNAGFFINGKIRYTCLNDSSHTKDETIPSSLAADYDLRFQFIAFAVSILVSLVAGAALTNKSMKNIMKKLKKMIKIKKKETGAMETMASAAAVIAENAIKEDEGARMEKNDAEKDNTDS